MEDKNLVLGIDFGTTNSSAAIYKDGEVKVFNIDPENSNPKTLKSSIFISRENEVSVGQKAINEYLEKFEGHEIKSDFHLTDEYMEVIKDVEGGTIQERVVDEYEINLQGRFIISPKRVMPNPYFTETEAFGKIYTAEDLATIILKRIKNEVEKELGFEIKNVNIGRPVHFSDVGLDELAVNRITTAAKNAGFENINFTYEPIGAAYNFALKNDQKKLGIVFDFGGGTFDTSVVEFNPDHSLKVIANNGVYVGGNRFNEQIIYKKFMQHFARDIKWGPAAQPIPQWIMDNATRWEMTVTMRKKENIELMESIRRQADNPRSVENLIKLIKYNLGLSLFLTAEKAKIDLSSASIDDFIPMKWKGQNLDFEEEISQEEMKNIVWSDISRIVQSIREVMEEAQITRDDIDVVIKTGGSSRTFFINELLQNMFPKAEIFENDAFTDVTAGLAISGSKII